MLWRAMTNDEMDHSPRGILCPLIRNSSFTQVLRPKLRGRRTCRCPERPRESAVIVKAAGQCDVRHRAITFDEQLRGGRKATLTDELCRREPENSLDKTREPNRGKSSAPRQLGWRERFVE